MTDKYHRAARDGYLDILREANRKEMNSPDEDGCTPPMLASQHGNLEALRATITRGGDVNKMDLLGFTAIHHAARNGHWNCVSFLISFGANIWSMDNDYHTALDIAAMENKEDIVKMLDAAQNEQIRKNPKVIQKLKEKAMKDAENNLKQYERLQEKASKELEKARRQMEREDSIQNGNDFKAPTKESFVKTLTQRIKGKNTKSKATSRTAAFSDLVNGTAKGSRTRNMEGLSTNEFSVSEVDDSGKRTFRSIRGTASRKDGQVLYIANIDIDGADEKSTDNSARPALTNVFPNAAVGGDSRDSGVDNSFDDDEGKPGLFNRPVFGNISFLNHFQHTNSFQNQANVSLDETDSGYQNGDSPNGFDDDNSDKKRFSSGTESTNGIVEADKDLPWRAEDVEELDDEDDDSEYTPVIMFLEGCGLRLYTHLFLDADVDMDALMVLTNQDFQDMGLPIGPRRKLMDAVQRRRIVLNEPAQMYDSQI